jgi:iron complex outermembrane recepter protein
MFVSKNRRVPSSLPIALRTALALATVAVPPVFAADVNVEEILVTATRVTTTLQDTPAAISVVTGDAIRAGGVRNITDMQYEVPSLSVGHQFGVNRTFIRGIGLGNIELGADGSVAFHVDGAPVALPAAQLSTYFDIERVEVLRGPQGTLYGRNATGGSINLVTRKPTDRLAGDVTLTYGNYASVIAEGAIGGPIGERVRMRVAGKAEQRDGYGQNFYTKNDVNNRNAQAVRATVQWLPMDNLDVTVTGDYSKENDNNYALNYFGPTTIDPIYGQLFGGRTLADVVANPDPQDINSDIDPENEREGAGVMGTITWSQDDLTIQSITAYREYDRRNLQDLDGTDFNAYSRLTYLEESETLSQELTATWAKEHWTMLLGANYFTEELFGVTRGPLTNVDLLIPTAPPDALFDQRGTINIDAYGIFVQGTYRLGDHWAFTAGIRYSDEERDMVDSTFTFSAVGVVGLPTDKSGSWDAWTPKLNVQYTFDNGTLVYGNVERGFKSGVISIGTPNPVVNPEYVWSYEVGVKNRLWDDRVEMATTAFYYDYTDLQVGRVEELSPVTENAASARNMGLEFEIHSRLTDNLGVDFFATYLDAEFTEFTTKEPNRPQLGVQDLSGNRLINAPEFTYRLGLNYSVPVMTAGNLGLRAELSWVDDVYFTEFNNSDAFQEAYSMVNASARYEGSNGHWSVELWGRNLSDETVKANNIVGSFLYAFPQFGSLLPPRTYGVSFGYRL